MATRRVWHRTFVKRICRLPTRSDRPRTTALGAVYRPVAPEHRPACGSEQATAALGETRPAAWVRPSCALAARCGLTNHASPNMGPGPASVQPTRAIDTDPQQQGREVKGYRCANTRGATMLPGTTLAEGHVHMML